MPYKSNQVTPSKQFILTELLKILIQLARAQLCPDLSCFFPSNSKEHIGWCLSRNTSLTPFPVASNLYYHHVKASHSVLLGATLHKLEQARAEVLQLINDPIDPALQGPYRHSAIWLL